MRLPAGVPYETVYFNQTPIVNGEPSPGGESNEVDFRNLNQSTSMIVDINGFLGNGLNQVADTEANFLGLSITVIAHELGHTLGLRHEDALGPIGFGISNPHSAPTATTRLIPAWSAPSRPTISASSPAPPPSRLR